MAGHDPHDENISILAHYKHNLSKAGPSLKFTITEDGKFKWLGPSSLRADDLVAQPEDADSRTAVEDAVEFLREELKDGPLTATEVQSKADKLKISIASLRRAKKALNIKPRKGMKEQAGQWFWELPARPDEAPNQGAQA